METLGQRVAARRLQLVMTQDELAAAAGMSQQGINSIEKGESERPRKLTEIAVALQVTERWLLYREGPDPKAGEVQEQSQASEGKGLSDMGQSQFIPGGDLVGEKDLPVYAAAEGGSGHLIVSFDAIDYVRRPQPLIYTKGAYGILVTGESMVPAFRPGDIALVSPKMPPAGGEDVLLYHTPPSGDAEATIKRLVGWTDKKWKLEQYNPADKFSLDRADWATCHWVVGKYNRR